MHVAAMLAPLGWGYLEEIDLCLGFYYVNQSGFQLGPFFFDI